MKEQKKLYEQGTITESLSYIFPELKESEDEEIRKSIIAILNNYVDNSNTFKSKMIVWLEKQETSYTKKDIDDAYLKGISDTKNELKKQGEQKSVNFEEAEKEKSDFVSGKFIQCRKSFNGFKEDNSYWLEYIGDDTYTGRSDNILNQKFHITPRQLYRLFSQEHCIKNNNEEKGEQL